MKRRSFLAGVAALPITVLAGINPAQAQVQITGFSYFNKPISMKEIEELKQTHPGRCIQINAAVTNQYGCHFPHMVAFVRAKNFNEDNMREQCALMVKSVESARS